MYVLKLIRRGWKAEESAYLNHKWNYFWQKTSFCILASSHPFLCPLLFACALTFNQHQFVKTQSALTCRLAGARGLRLALSTVRSVFSLRWHKYSFQNCDYERWTSNREHRRREEPCVIRADSGFIGLKDHFCSYSGWNRDGEDLMNQNVKDIWGIVLRI